MSNETFDTKLDMITFNQRSEPTLAPNESGVAYLQQSFVARYAAVWAYGLGDPSRTSEPYYQRLLDACARNLTEPPASVLDAGCGPGRLIADLAERFPESTCTGIDTSQVMIETARAIIHAPVANTVPFDAGDYGFPTVELPARGRPDVQLHHRSLEQHADLPIQHDLVVASHLLDRVQHPRHALGLLTRCTAPGGQLVVTCAFNYNQRHQWTMRSAADLALEIRRHGLTVAQMVDDIEYRERLDIRGTVTTHVVALVIAKRTANQAPLTAGP